MEEKETKSFSLSVILNRVKSIFDESISTIPFWMKTEIAQINKDRKGNYYLELVESKDQLILAKARATIWQSTALNIQHKLGADAVNILKDGAEILCQCTLVFHPVFGLSINITDIDLQFSLGEVEKRKQQTLDKLKDENLLNRNKSHYLPLVIQRIALISSEETAGHVDFINQLTYNSFNYSFHITHFNCRVQGEYAVPDITEQLNKITPQHYDAVVIIRGGGATLDLDSFNDYTLAKAIALMDIAVLTGIGHETDTTVADFVAHTRFKTPSAVASFLIEKANQFDVAITQKMKSIQEVYKHIVTVENHRISSQSKSFKLNVSELLHKKKADLKSVSNKVSYLSKHSLHQEHSFLKTIQDIVVLSSKRRIHSEKTEIKELSKTLQYIFKHQYTVEKQKLTGHETQLKLHLKGKIKREHLRIVQLENIKSFYSFDSLLKRGFSIVRHNNKTLKPTVQLQAGDTLDIETYEKHLAVTISKIKESEKWKNLPTKKHPKN